MKKIIKMAASCLLVLSLTCCGSEKEVSVETTYSSNEVVSTEDIEETAPNDETSEKPDDNQLSDDSSEKPDETSDEAPVPGDETPTDENPTPGDETPDKTPIPDDSGARLVFSTMDIDGNPVTDEIIKDAKVVMLNFWEPWCGPCVNELPELEKLYENYKDQGLLILGVFSSFDMEEEAKQIAGDSGITYPILYFDFSMLEYMTDYFPTTVFFDGEGRLLSPEPYIGSNDYSGWEATLKEYLK